MNAQLLREKLQSELVSFGVLNTTHKTLPAYLVKLGLPNLPPPEGLSKAQLIELNLAAVADADLPQVAGNYLNAHCPHATTRNTIQDILWEGWRPEIPKRFRRELARAVRNPLFQNAAEFLNLLGRLWLVDTDPFDSFFGSRGSQSLRARIEKHLIQNPDDWDAERLFEELGAFGASDRRFALFLEGLASADVLSDVAAQNVFVGSVNGVLRSCGVELRETGADGGYPVFQIVALHTGVPGALKNLIFASSVKPDLRLTDAINNNVEVVTNIDKVLIYDRAIREEGLTWAHLQDWWASTNHLADPAEAKRSLYDRLLGCLPATSPPQRFFHLSYFRLFRGRIPLLPALLPEVWLHWDPQTAKQRGPDALLRSRMDFLMLLPNRVRVVLEIDGKQHYSADDGRADVKRYAEMVYADRDLKLSGYEVFRFGGGELGDQAQADRVAAGFFPPLFERFGVK